MTAARLILAVSAAMQVAMANADDSAAAVGVAAQDLETALRFAPVLKFDRASEGYPMSAQTFYEEGGGQPELVEQMTRKVQNTNKGSLTSLANQPPTYFKTTQINGQVRINYWWFYGYQEPCVDVPLLGRLRHRKGLIDDVGDVLENLGGEILGGLEDGANAVADGFEWLQDQAHVKEGHHNGDWENVMVALDAEGANVESVTYSQHGGHYTKFVANGQGLPIEGGTHPVVFVGKIAHGSYHDGHASHADAVVVAAGAAAVVAGAVLGPGAAVAGAAAVAAVGPAGGAAAVEPLNAVQVGWQCRYFEDDRSPATASDVMHAATNLVDLRGESEAWLVAAQSTDWDWGHDGISTNPVQREQADTDLSCDEDGCARSECLPTQDRQTRQRARARRLGLSDFSDLLGDGLDDINTGVSDFGDSLGDGVDSIGSELEDFFGDLVSDLEKLGDAIGADADEAIDSVGDAFADLVSDLEKLGVAIGDGADEAIDSVGDAFGDLVSDLEKLGNAIGDGAGEAIDTVGGAIVTAGETVYRFGEDAVDATRDFLGVEDRDITTDATCSSSATGTTNPIAFPLPTPGGFTRTHTIEMEFAVAKPLDQMSGSEVDDLKAAIATETVETTALTHDDIDDVALTTTAGAGAADGSIAVRGRRTELTSNVPQRVHGQIVLTGAVSKSDAVAALNAIATAAGKGGFQLNSELQVQLMPETLRSAVTAQGPAHTFEVDDEETPGGEKDSAVTAAVSTIATLAAVVVALL